MPGQFFSRRRGRQLWAAAMLLLLLFLTSCSNLGYYGQAAWGQARILLKRRPIERLLADAGTPQALRDKLQAVQRIREFAASELLLPAGGSYRTYVELPPAVDGGRRSAVVWNVVAAPELSIEPLTWCFPVAGCVAYRGYFSEARARRYADRLRRRGYDVAVAGAAAYSTLGWFDDPVLSTVIDYPQVHLAGLLFHELAHRLIYLKGDTRFNESFATAVETEGVRRWLARTDQPAELAEGYLAQLHRQAELSNVLLDFRSQLAEIYGAEAGDDWKRQRKRQVLAQLQQTCRRLEASWAAVGGSVGRWAKGEVNNADLVSVGSYRELVGAFEHLLERHDGDLRAFYGAVRRLAAASPEDRRAGLSGLASLPGSEPPAGG